MIYLNFVKAKTEIGVLEVFRSLQLETGKSYKIVNVAMNNKNEWVCWFYDDK
jgi:hypothetical protein